MPFESKAYNYNLPKESIKQEPYKNPNLSKLLIAESKEIIDFAILFLLFKGHLYLL